MKGALMMKRSLEMQLMELKNEEDVQSPQEGCRIEMCKSQTPNALRGEKGK